MKVFLALYAFLFSYSILSKEIKIIALGDSLTEGYGVSQEEAFPKQLEILLKKDFPKLKMINSGISGSTTASATKRLKWLLKSKPTHVLLALGANDGLRGIRPGASENNLQKAIDLAQKKSIKVILLGMVLPYNYGEGYRKKFSQTFENLAKKNKLAFYPFLLKGVGGKTELNLPDGIHPNPQGHKVMAKNLYEFLKGQL